MTVPKSKTEGSRNGTRVITKRIAAMLERASPRPWVAGVFTLGDGTGQMIVSDANGDPVFFVVDQNPDNAQLGALAFAESWLALHEALEKLLDTCHCDHSRNRCRCDLLEAAELALRVADLEKAMGE